MATPHIDAAPGDFADIVLMPGDPLRAQYIAETYLADARQVNRVRNMAGYTGTYRGRRVSVMGHGMGIPSVSIYAKELITEYGVTRLIRVGSCGAVRDDVALRDVVIGLGASTDSGVNRARFAGMDFAATADFALSRALVDAADKLGVTTRVGNLFSADLFYDPRPDTAELLRRYGVVGVEMEAAGLYGVAAEFGARAATICTVSDHILKGDSLDSRARERSFDDMMRVALDAVLLDDHHQGGSEADA
ncbi:MULTISPECIES: purine-nucleoside phosphorylase [unclassified Halomonas]|uniref:purine-nucleoside phosphorylase n=1 Tax=unclassified Halomonas TaxID=2609666 RepID=UPI0028871182|nr:MULTISPECIES: purine-nucleoside phosphorylase [unclassified Halomonas]MDT0500808.1 purine-nucleoside phosphorylase [Halomonas sp. PAR7]MDT0513002.1 purine-nucleoside phosphorylase [Halomonas sp. LES1]MDT0591587.1 purine-nucleoside phosphorylase [Halomonas sp. PAR8]